MKSWKNSSKCWQIFWMDSGKQFHPKTGDNYNTIATRGRAPLLWGMINGSLATAPRIALQHSPLLSIVIWAFALMLAPALPGARPAVAQEKQIFRVAVEDHYPPFSMLDESNQPHGFNVDMAFALGKTMNMPCTVCALPWHELLPALLENRVDAVIANMAKTPERCNIVSFTKPYQRSKTGFVARQGQSLQVNPQNVAGKRICTQADTMQYQYLKRKYGEVVTLQGMATMKDGLIAVANGTCDLALTPLLTAFDFLQSEEGRQCELAGDALSLKEFPYSTSHIAVRKTDTDLRKELDEAIDSICASGEHYTISRKYFPFSAL